MICNPISDIPFIRFVVIKVLSILIVSLPTGFQRRLDTFLLGTAHFPHRAPVPPTLPITVLITKLLLGFFGRLFLLIVPPRTLIICCRLLRL